MHVLLHRPLPHLQTQPAAAGHPHLAAALAASGPFSSSAASRWAALRSPWRCWPTARSCLFALLHGRWPLAPFVATPLGFALAAWLAGRYFPNSGGSGIPQVIAAHQMSEPASARPAGQPEGRGGQDPAAAARARLRGLVGSRRTDRAGRRRGDVRARPLRAASPAGPPDRRLGGRDRGGLQRAAGRHHLRDRGDEPLLRGEDERADPRDRDRGRPHVARDRRRLHLFRHDGRHVAVRAAMDRAAGGGPRGRALRGRVQPHPDRGGPRLPGSDRRGHQGMADPLRGALRAGGGALRRRLRRTASSGRATSRPRPSCTAHRICPGPSGR